MSRKEAEELKFKISIKLKDLIGRELVTNKQIAVMELVKNSHDAYSPSVRIMFHNEEKEKMPSEPPKPPPQQISIIDKGKGMSSDDIKDKWMWVGWSEKREGPVLPPQKRGHVSTPALTMAGTKGIGRFSCDKLGRISDLYTKSKPGLWNHLKVDWGDFEGEDQKKEFQTVKSTLDKTQPPDWMNVADYDTGTIVHVSELREVWDLDDMMKLKGWLERLTDPFVEHETSFKIYIDAPMFKEEEKETGNLVNGLLESLLPTKLERNTTMVSCSISAGRATTRLTDKGRLLYEVVDDLSQSAFLKNIAATIEVYYLSEAAKMAFTKAMGIRAVEYGSVMLYRNNFRVMPFGEPGDDWLTLETRKGQGYRRFLSRRELVGHVSLRDEVGIFEEVSSRAAGIRNEDALEELKEFIFEKIVKRLEKYVVDVIRWDSPDVEVSAENKGIKLLETVSSLAGGSEGVLRITPGKEAYTLIREAELTNAETIIDNLNALSESSEGQGTGEIISENVKALKTVVQLVKRELAAKEAQVLFLERSEARQGELIEMMQHAFAIVNDLAVPALKAAIDQALKLDLPESYLEKLASVKEAVQKLMRLSQMASSAKFDLGKEKIETDLVSYTGQYLRWQWLDSLKEWGIRLHVEESEIDYHRKLDILAYSIIIDNLVHNSYNAECRNFFVRFTKDDKKLSILFGDDGKGIS